MRKFIPNIPHWSIPIICLCVFGLAATICWIYGHKYEIEHTVSYTNSVPARLVLTDSVTYGNETPLSGYDILKDTITGREWLIVRYKGIAITEIVPKDQ